MRSRRTAGLGLLCLSAVFALAGCQSTEATCSAGLTAQFELTISNPGSTEPSVQYFALGHCTPHPTAGPIPRVQQNTADDHAATVTHLGQGDWQIRPRTLGDTPTTAAIRLYRNGTLTSTHTVHLAWPKQDPCAASNPPDPHPTIRN